MEKHQASSRRRFPALLPLLLAVLLIGAGTARSEDRLEGQLDLQWGDPDPEAPAAPATLRVFLTDDDGARRELDVAASGLGPLQLQELAGRRVEAIPAPPPLSPSAWSGPARLAVEALLPLPGAAGPANLLAGDSAAESPVSGSKPWLSVLCKFADVAAEPRSLSFFQEMYANQPGRLDDYWREVSYGMVDVAGSTAIGWVTLPHNRSHYVPTPGSGSNADLTALFSDCTAAVDATVDFSNGGGGYEGINLMFNGLLDCCAWGGGIWATLDGVSKLWRVTWEPPWGYADEAVIAHEMGHGFGLPHSNNWDGDSSPYDNPWDVMSAATSYAVSDPTYGRLGKHTNAHHKDRLGWIPEAQRFEPPGDGEFTLTLDHLAVAATSNYRMARIPIPASDSSYVVEARERSGGYDGNLPGNGVLIYHVDPNRGEPAWLYDEAVPPAGFGNQPGSLWQVGEVFQDPVSSISVSVDAATADGFLVTLTLGPSAVATPLPGALAFGDVELGEARSLALTLANTTSGSAVLEILSLILSNSADFQFDAGAGAQPCGSLTPTLAAGTSCTVGVTFQPGAAGLYSDLLTLVSNGDPEEQTIPLSGRGVHCSAAEDDLILPATEEYGSPVLKEACASITATSYQVMADANVTFQAPVISLGEGFRVAAGGAFAAGPLP